MTIERNAAPQGRARYSEERQRNTQAKGKENSPLVSSGNALISMRKKPYSEAWRFSTWWARGDFLPRGAAHWTVLPTCHSFRCSSRSSQNGLRPAAAAAAAAAVAAEQKRPAIAMPSRQCPSSQCILRLRARPLPLSSSVAWPSSGPPAPRSWPPAPRALPDSPSHAAGGWLVRQKTERKRQSSAQQDGLRQRLRRWSTFNRLPLRVGGPLTLLPLGRQRDLLPARPLRRRALPAAGRQLFSRVNDRGHDDALGRRGLVDNTLRRPTITRAAFGHHGAAGCDRR